MNDKIIAELRALMRECKVDHNFYTPEQKFDEILSRIEAEQGEGLRVKLLTIANDGCGCECCEITRKELNEIVDTIPTPKDEPLAKDDTIRNILLEAMGFASLCWEPRPTGVFDSNRAIDFADDILSRRYPVPLAVLADNKGMKLNISCPKKEWAIGIRRKGAGTDKKGPIVCYHSYLYEGAEIYTRAYLNPLPNAKGGK